jgi:hypothetical protein
MMNHHETITRKPSPASGLRARRRAFPGVKRGGGTWLGSISVLGAVIAAFLALCAGPASAALVHPYESQLTEIGGFTPYSFANPEGIAVDSGGDIWVTDTGSGTVDKFTPAGTFETQSNGAGSFANSPYIESAAWSNAAKLLFVSDSNVDDLWGLEAGGGYSKTDLKSGLGSGCCYIRVAADNSGGATDGDLYVFSRGSVIRIDASGKPVDYTAGASAGTNELSGADTPAKSFGEPSFRSGGGIAVDSAGRLLVADGDHHVVDVFAPSGEFIEAITEAGSGQELGDVSAVASDPTTGNILVADPTHAVIDEFNLAGAFVGQIDEVNGAPLGAIQGIAIDSTGRIYAANGTHRVVDVFGPVAVLPDVTTGAVTHLAETDTSLTLNGTVDTAGTTSSTALTSCHFQYVTQGAFEKTGFSDLSSGGEQPCVPAAGSIPNDGAPHSVSADLSGLIPNVIYSYRLVAANAKGASYGTVATTPALIGIVDESVIDVSTTSTSFAAEINPHGVATAYHFEYISEAAYQANGGSFTGSASATVVPVPDASIGAGEAPVSVSQRVTGLSPSTVYHYRVRAANSLAPVTGPDRTFTTETPGALALPDDRGWELVSPPDKHGASLASLFGVQAAAAGDAIAYLASGATEAQPAGFPNEAQVLSTRTGAGWESRDINAPHQAATDPEGEFRLFSQDLSRAAIESIGRFNPAISPEATELTPYLRTNYAPGDPGSPCLSSCFRPLLSGAPGFANVPAGVEFGEEQRCLAPQNPNFCGPVFAGASADLGSVVIEAVEPLTPGAPTGIVNVSGVRMGSLYEWSAGRLSLVSVLPDGEPAPPVYGLTLGALSGDKTRRRHAISPDGSRVVWSEDDPTNGAEGHLYLRYNATQPQSAVNGSGECSEAARACTLQLDQITSGSGEGQVAPSFQTASADDSRIFFTDEQRLTANSGAAGQKPDLYECEVASAKDGALECALTDLTPEPGSGEPADVAGAVLGASEDGSSVYFAAAGVLTGTEENAQHERAEPGNCQQLTATTCNLYREHNGRITFIATLSTTRDETDWGGVRGGFEELTARVSPDGEWLTFMSARPLADYDNRDAVTGLPDQEVYLYDAHTGQLVCASCNPSGARPYGVGTGGFNSLAGLDRAGGPFAASIPTWHTLLGDYQTRYLSDSGRLFFDAADALVPQDGNGTQDVYEYEPPGVGTCTEASTGFAKAAAGCIALISSGASEQESVFMDASESGDDIFFLTASKLSPRDTDTSYDVYDGRVGGSEVQPTPPPACEGDSCQSPAQVPNDPTPGSLTFSGPGNLESSAPATQKKKATAVSRAGRLAKALKACKRTTSKRRRAQCVASARKRYRPARRTTAKRSTHDRGAKS